MNLYFLSQIIGNLSDPPYILRQCMCYGLIVAMATSLIQNFKYNQKRLLLCCHQAIETFSW